MEEKVKYRLLIRESWSPTESQLKQTYLKNYLLMVLVNKLDVKDALNLLN